MSSNRIVEIRKIGGKCNGAKKENKDLKIEEAEISFIKWIVEQKTPVILVLTKCYDLTKANLLKKTN